MSWTELSAVDLRLCFIAECPRFDAPFGVVCARHGISRKTGYKWLGRYETGGAAGLVDRSSAPLGRPYTSDAALLDRIAGLRRERPSWGPRKLLARLKLDDPGQPWPAASTVGDFLRREGLVEPRPRRRQVLRSVRHPIAPQAANQSWSADFNGWFRTGDGVRCEPLTVTDNFSRFLLVSHAVPRPTFVEIRPLFLRAFEEYGLPERLRRTTAARLRAAAAWPG